MVRDPMMDSAPDGIFSICYIGTCAKRIAVLVFRLGGIMAPHLSLRVQVPNNHILTQNLY